MQSKKTLFLLRYGQTEPTKEKILSRAKRQKRKAIDFPTVIVYNKSNEKKLFPYPGGGIVF